MRLDVLEPDAFAFGDAGQRADLVDDQVLDLLRAQLHLAAAEAQQVGVAGMGADRDPVGARQPHGAPHRPRVAGVPAAGDVGRRHHRHQQRVLAHRPGAERLAQVGVQVDPHGRIVAGAAAGPRDALGAGLGTRDSGCGRHVQGPPTQTGARAECQRDGVIARPEPEPPAPSPSSLNNCTSIAFWACSRFSAWSKTTDAGDSMTSSVTSSRDAPAGSA